MGSLTFNKCCGCIELKTGCFIIGYLSLIVYLIATIACIALLGIGAVAINTSAEDDKNTENLEAFGLVAIIFAVVVILGLAFALTFVIVLLVGLHKNKPGHVKAYLICGAIFFVLSVLYTFSSLFGSGPEAQEARKPGNIAGNIFHLLLELYFLLVIRSQYLVMKSPERGPAIYSAA